MRYKRWTPQRLRSVGSYWQARILSTVVHLELFDWLGKEAKGSRAATGHFGGTQEVWEIFLDALSAMGVLRKRSVRYANSRFALRHLCSGNGSFLLPDHDAWESWETLPDLLTTRQRPKISQPFFTDRKRAERLLQSLDHDARKIAPYLIARLPLSRSMTLLDIGGGLGTFALACCRRSQHLRATVVEHQRMIPLVARAIETDNMA